MKNKAWQKVIGFVIGIAVVLLLPLLFLSQPYQLSILIFMLLNIVFAVSMRLIMTTGQITLGHAAFAAIGGYTTTLLVTKMGFTFWESLPLAGIVAIILALVIGYPTLRLKGGYFAILTFALSEAVRYVFQTWKDIFGGSFGIVNIPPPDAISIPGVFTIAFTSRVSQYYLIAVFAIIAILFMYRVEKSRFGLIFHSIGAADSLSEHTGVNIMNQKVLAFVIGSFFAAIAGVLQTHYLTIINPFTFTFHSTVRYLIYGVLGGTGSFFGPIIGACIFTPLPELLRPLKEFESIIYALVLLIGILFFPGGIMSIFQRRKKRGSA